MRPLPIIAALLCAASGAIAQSQNYSDEEITAALAQCKFPTGEHIAPAERCRQAQASWESTIANFEKQKARADEARVAAEKERERAAAQEADRIQKQKELDEYLSNRRREEEAARAKEQAEAEARYAEIDRAAAKRQKACGRDYESPRIGMTLKRATQCIDGLVLSGQVNRRDGVISRYEGGGVYLHVMRGQVVSWGEN